MSDAASTLKLYLERYAHYFEPLDVPARTILLREGEVSRRAYYIRSGCLRLWFNSQGKDITFQFFFEQEAVSSMESFRTARPSLFNLETIEPSSLWVIAKEHYSLMEREIPGYQDYLREILFERIAHYAGLFLSRIKDSPQKRYLDLLENQPAVLERVPQHYIASYLGITPVSLSRIRNKVKSSPGGLKRR